MKSKRKKRRKLTQQYNILRSLPAKREEEKTSRRVAENTKPNKVAEIIKVDKI